MNGFVAGPKARRRLQRARLKVADYWRALGLGLLLCWGLSGCTATPQECPAGCAPLKPAPPVPANLSGALIVTDISGSMNGFAQPGTTRLYTLHEQLQQAARDAVAASDPNNTKIDRCYLGDKLDCQTQHTLQDLTNSAVYRAGQSRLDLFLAKDKTEDAKDPLAGRRLVVLVTDGMAAQKEGAGNGGTCLGSADPQCVAYLLKQRVQEGYGVWLALVLTPFRGTHYAERPLDDALWQKTTQHVAALNQNPGPYFNGVTTQATRNGDGGTFEAFQFEGVKPLLIMALSPDPATGRKFIQQLGASLKNAPVAQPAGAVYTMELAPLTPPRRQISKVGLDPSIPADKVQQVKSARQGDYYSYKANCTRDGETTVLLDWADADAGTPLPEGVRFAYQLKQSGGNLPAQLLVPQDITDKDKGAKVRLSCKQLREGCYTACLGLEAGLQLDAAAGGFWSALSADNTYEAPERLYGLRELVQQVLAANAASRPLDRISFQVERK